MNFVSNVARALVPVALVATAVAAPPRLQRRAT